jgi:hypothetical protein
MRALGLQGRRPPPFGARVTGYLELSLVNPTAPLPSSQAALRPPGPLRTGREGFPSPSSSPSNASLEETRFRNEKTLTMNPVMALGMK